MADHDDFHGGYGGGNYGGYTVLLSNYELLQLACQE